MISHIQIASRMYVHHLLAAFYWKSEISSRCFVPINTNHYQLCSAIFGSLNYLNFLSVTFFCVNAQVTTAILRDGRRLPADMVVVGIGARANTALFEGQLVMEKGGIKANGKMQTSDASVYAVGDVATFPVKLLGGGARRFEHVDCARRTARHAVAAALDAHVAGVPEEDLWRAVEWLHARQQQQEGGATGPFQMYGPELTCVALDHVPMYGAEFEAGAPPARVSCRVGGATGEGLVIVLPAAEGGEARDVVVTLPAEATARVCGDGEVLRHGAQVVFGAKAGKEA